MSNTATFRFYEELNDFLQPEQVKQSFSYAFNDHPAIKDAIEALGVPHTEVDLIVVNDASVDFTYQLQHNDRVAVYPVFEAFDITPVIRLRPGPLRDPRFILDVHLGKLARNLRMLGFDTLYRNDYRDKEIIAKSLYEQRIILTRDQGILKHSAVTHGCYLYHTDPDEQTAEIINRLQLLHECTPFSRCINCNGLLHAVEKEKIKDLLPPQTEQFYHTFYQCNSCFQLYWQGSHYENMQQKIARLLDMQNVKE